MLMWFGFFSSILSLRKSGLIARKSLGLRRNALVRINSQFRGKHSYVELLESHVRGAEMGMERLPCRSIDTAGMNNQCNCIVPTV